MTGTPTPPTPQNNQNQATNNQWLTRIQRIRNLQTVAVSLVLLGSAYNILQAVNNITQGTESFCRANPSSRWCPSEKIDPEWIGTKIEDVYIKKLQNYEPETTLVVTDKSPDQIEEKDISILRNVDQGLSKINLGEKRNSGQYEALLRTAKKNGKPLCLIIYGKRKFATSEFKNIISIQDFPDSKTYDSLNSEKRDQRCKQLPTPITPKSGNLK